MPSRHLNVRTPMDRTHARRLRQAERHLSGSHPEMARIVTAVGRCTLQPLPDLFRVLVSTVVSQQISVKAAESIVDRIDQLVGRRKLTAAAIHACREADLRACGLSSAKLRTLRELSASIVERKLNLKRLAKLDDQAVADALLPIPGIGPWSVQMVLIFGLCRLDVLPVGDLGFRHGVMEVFGLSETPTVEEMHALAEPWRPFRTIATWYLWRSRRLQMPTD